MRRSSIWKLSNFELYRKALRISYLSFTSWWLNKQNNNNNNNNNNKSPFHHDILWSMGKTVSRNDNQVLLLDTLWKVILCGKHIIIHTLKHVCITGVSIKKKTPAYKTQTHVSIHLLETARSEAYSRI